MRKYKRFNYDKEIFNRDYLVYYLPFYSYLLEYDIIKKYNADDTYLHFEPNLTLKKLDYIINKYDDIVPLYNTCIYLLSDTDDDTTLCNFWTMIRYINKYRQRLNHMKQKIELYLQNYDCSFITLTFDDEHLQYANDINIKRFLNKLNVNYIANVDYGGINNRKHYHAIITSQDIDLSLYNYGAINIRKIVIKDSVNLANYLIKLTSHGFKETDKVIYSRKKRK